MVSSKSKRRLKDMLKKVFSTLTAVAFAFGAFSKIDVLKNIANACSYVCCEHNGAGWDN